MEIHQDVIPSPQDTSQVFELINQDPKQEENSFKNTSSIQIIQNEHEIDNKQVLISSYAQCNRNLTFNFECFG